jgi:DNA-binding PadR family transcriptional regulator
VSARPGYTQIVSNVVLNTAASGTAQDVTLAEYAILGLLRERPMHGYEIARRFAADLDLGLVLPLDMSNVYALLKDLHEQGLIEGRRETVGRRPPRTVYSLTPGAEALLDRWLSRPVARLREVRADLLVKLYFCRMAGERQTARLLDAQIAASRAYLDRLHRLVQDAGPHGFERLVHASKVGAARATVAWLEEERGRIAGHSEPHARNG